MTKLCECGCGKPAPIATHNQTRYGYVKGLPMRFIKGHHLRVRGLHTHNRKHGMSGAPEYKAFLNARDRCENSKDKRYAEYGARGIKFRLESFEQFFAHIGPRPEGVDGIGKALYSLDRIDNDGDYCIGNVRWATRLEQEHNKGPRKPHSSEAREHMRKAALQRSRTNVRNTEIVLSTATA